MKQVNVRCMFVENLFLKSVRIFDWTGVPETDKMDELKEYDETQMDVLIAH